MEPLEEVVVFLEELVDTEALLLAEELSCAEVLHMEVPPGMEPLPLAVPGSAVLGSVVLVSAVLVCLMVLGSAADPAVVTEAAPAVTARELL